MSAYQVEKLIWRAEHEPPFRAALAADPEGMIATLPLSEEERRILRAGEVEKLYQMGVHPYLLGHITRFNIFGITTEWYRQRMRLISEDGKLRNEAS